MKGEFGEDTGGYNKKPCQHVNVKSLVQLPKLCY